MNKKNEIFKETEFKNWLPNNGVKSPNSINTYISNLKKLQTLFGMDLVTLLKEGIDSFHKQIEVNANGNIEKSRESDYKSISLKYWEFLEALKLPFKNEKAFSKWLPLNNVKSAKSISSYLSTIRSIQRKLGGDIDGLLSDGWMQLHERINADAYCDIKDTTKSDHKSISLKYWEFLQSEKIAFRQELDFKNWLPDNGVVKTVGDYLSYIKTVQLYLGDINELVKSDKERVIERVTHENFPLKASSSLNAYRAAIRKYYKFVESKN